MNRRDLLAILPPAKGSEKIITPDQDVDDIVQEVLDAHQVFKPDYDQIAKKFAGGSTEKKLYDFCRRNLRYVVESIKTQTTNSPTVLLEKGYCDCKGYAGFIAGVLDACNRAGYGNYDWCFRFGMYQNLYEDNWHVFVVVRREDGSDTWIDPCLDHFNKRYPSPDEYEDKMVPMTLIRMSGVIPGGSNCGCSPASVLSGYMGAPTVSNTTPTPPNPTTANVAFNEAGTGILLPSIDGYPPDLPQLQLTQSGRLCFFNWPLWLDNPVWVDFKYITPTNPVPPITQAFSTLDWDGTYLGRIRTATNLGKPGDPVAMAKAQELIDGAANGTYIWNYFTYRQGWDFDQRSPYQWIFQNIQYYINRYLKNPYPVNGYIPYGTNWFDQFKASIQGGQGKVKTYCEQCNFLVQPVGSVGFWDKFYSAVPLLISAAASIITAGAATPALVLAIANFGIKAAQQAQANQAAADNPIQGSPIYNTATLTEDLTPKTTTSMATTAAGKVVTWVKANPVPAIGIAALIIAGIYELVND